MTQTSAAETPVPELKLDDLSELSPEQLATMLEAGEEVLECQRVLGKANLNVVGELLKGQAEFVQFNHYPKGDVFDKDSASQYYYHAHRGMPGENGHFHTFLRRGGMPEDVQSVPNDGEAKWPAGEDAVAHLGAISMDKYGYPIGLFMTNRWVTDEVWYRATDVVRMLDHFVIDHAYPSWPTNRWLTGMVRLYRPELEALLAHRDVVVGQWAQAYPDQDVYEDRKLEVTGEIRISIKKRIGALRTLLQR